MESLYGNGQTLVNSAHEVAVDRVAWGFAATARCSAGVIEAIESEQEDWFAIGVQFHPEPEARPGPDVASHPELRIFEAFLDDVIAEASDSAVAAARQLIPG